MSEPQWVFSTSPLSNILSEEIASILRQTTGEHLNAERILIMPFAKNGIILLQLDEEVLGALLWMKTNSLTARVLGFGVHPAYQGQGLGTKCWEKFM